MPMTSSDLSAPRTPRDVDNGRMLVLFGAVTLTAVSYGLWCRWDGEGIGEYPPFLLIASRAATVAQRVSWCRSDSRG